MHEPQHPLQFNTPPWPNGGESVVCVCVCVSSRSCCPLGCRAPVTAVVRGLGSPVKASVVCSRGKSGRRVGTPIFKLEPHSSQVFEQGAHVDVLR